VELFEQYISNMYAYEQEFYELLVAEVDKVIAKNYDFKGSLFDTRGDDLKMLLQANQWIFWSLWDYLEGYHTYKKDDQDEVSILQDKGIYIAKSFFTPKEVSELLLDWGESIESVPEITEEMHQKSLLNRFYFETINDVGYTIGSIHDGKKRVMHFTKNSVPKYFDKHLRKNNFLNSIVQKYYNFKREIEPSTVMAEHLYPPKYYREYEAWHIDNLADQFKIMVILEDMTEDDAPFIYVEGTHKIKEKYKDRYHKMYATNGMVTQEQNHFEASFTETSLVKKGILKAGDVILFDCRLHHSATFAKNGGNRKNIMLYYNSLPTAKNKFLFKIDKYLKFGLK